MERPQTFAQWLKAKRLGVGMTQEQLAERGSFDDSYINKLERGRVTLPNPDTRQRIHAVLGTNDEELRRLGIVKNGVGRVAAPSPEGPPANAGRTADGLTNEERKAALHKLVDDLHPWKLGFALFTLRKIDESTLVGFGPES